MKKNKQASFAFITALSLFIFSCGPNDSKGGMDQNNSHKEGAVDSTKIPNFDSTHASDSSHASLSGHDIHIHSIELNSGKIKRAYSEKENNILYSQAGS